MSEAVERRFGSIKVKKVKKKDRVQTEWEEPTESKKDWRGRSLDEPEKAPQGFYDALEAFKPTILKWMASTLSIDTNTLKVEAEVKVLGLAYKYTDRGTYTVHVSATVRLPGFDSPLPLNFPAKVPDEDLRKLIDDLEFETVGYINGDRGQLDLDLPDGDGDEAEKDNADDPVEV